MSANKSKGCTGFGTAAGGKSSSALTASQRAAASTFLFTSNATGDVGDAVEEDRLVEVDESLLGEAALESAWIFEEDAAATGEAVPTMEVEVVAPTVDTTASSPAAAAFRPPRSAAEGGTTDAAKAAQKKRPTRKRSTRRAAFKRPRAADATSAAAAAPSAVEIVAKKRAKAAAFKKRSLVPQKQKKEEETTTAAAPGVAAAAPEREATAAAAAAAPEDSSSSTSASTSTSSTSAPLPLASVAVSEDVRAQIAEKRELALQKLNAKRAAQKQEREASVAAAEANGTSSASTSAATASASASSAPKVKQTGDAAATRVLPSSWLPTGISALDARLGGGLPRGQLCEIHGASASGKTQLCYTLAVNATLSVARPAQRVLWFDCGSKGFRVARLKQVIAGQTSQLSEDCDGAAAAGETSSARASLLSAVAATATVRVLVAHEINSAASLKKGLSRLMTLGAPGAATSTTTTITTVAAGAAAAAVCERAAAATIAMPSTASSTAATAEDVDNAPTPLSSTVITPSATGEIGLIIVDGMGALFDGAYEERSQYKLKRAAFEATLSRLRAIAQRYKCAVLITNEVRLHTSSLHFFISLTSINTSLLVQTQNTKTGARQRQEQCARRLGKWYVVESPACCVLRPRRSPLRRAPLRPQAEFPRPRLIGFSAQWWWRR